MVGQEDPAGEDFDSMLRGVLRDYPDRPDRFGVREVKALHRYRSDRLALV